MAWDKYPFVTLTEKGLLLDVLVQPRASRNEIVGIHDGCLKIRLAAPPVEVAANKACVEFLAEVLGVSRSRISIVNGHSSRRKRILVEVTDPDKVLKALPL